MTAGNTVPYVATERMTFMLQETRAFGSVLERFEDEDPGPEPGARAKARLVRSRILGGLVILILVLISALAMLDVKAIPTSSPLDARAEFTTTLPDLVPSK